MYIANIYEAGSTCALNVLLVCSMNASSWKRGISCAFIACELYPVYTIKQT